VALLLPPPLDAEVDGIRRAVGDGALGRMPAHLTLVPPVNVREDRLGHALAVLRHAAAATRPFRAVLGPPATFLPDSPTLYLAVSGTGLADVDRLRERVFVDPLARPLTWPYVAHVTLADEAEPTRIAAALGVLRDYRVEVEFDRVHLLREVAGRVWVPIADVALAAAAVIGRGGLPVELTVSDEPDPEARALAQGEGVRWLTVTARREGAVVGYASGWWRGRAAHLAVLVGSTPPDGLGAARHLVAAFESEAAKRGCEQVTMAPAVKDAQDLE
jgi:2'-5' RNA ligase